MQGLVSFSWFPQQYQWRQKLLRLTVKYSSVPHSLNFHISYMISASECRQLLQLACEFWGCFIYFLSPNVRFFWQLPNMWNSPPGVKYIIILPLQLYMKTRYLSVILQSLSNLFVVQLLSATLVTILDAAGKNHNTATAVSLCNMYNLYYWICAIN